MCDTRYVTDTGWELIEPHLALGASGPIGDLHNQFNAVMWRFRTGSPWRDVPPSYGNWSTIYDRFRAWAGQGVFENLMNAVISMLTPGQAADSPRFIPVLDKMRVRGPVGRPRTRPAAAAGEGPSPPAPTAATCANATSRR